MEIKKSLIKTHNYILMNETTNLFQNNTKPCLSLRNCNNNSLKVSKGFIFHHCLYPIQSWGQLVASWQAEKQQKRIQSWCSSTVPRPAHGTFVWWTSNWQNVLQALQQRMLALEINYWISRYRCGCEWGYASKSFQNKNKT